MFICYNTSKDHDLLSCCLDGAWILNSQLFFIWDIAQCFPVVPIYIIHFHFIHECVWLYLILSCCLKKGLASKNENVLVIEDTCTASLSGICERWQLTPLVLLNRIYLSWIQTLYTVLRLSWVWCKWLTSKCENVTFEVQYCKIRSALLHYL